MERNARDGDYASVGSVTPRGAAVGGVADERRAGVARVNAELVSAAGDRREREERRVARAVRDDGEERARGDRVFAVRGAETWIARASDGSVPRAAIARGRVGCSRTWLR